MGARISLTSLRSARHSNGNLTDEQASPRARETWEGTNENYVWSCDSVGHRCGCRQRHRRDTSRRSNTIAAARLGLWRPAAAGSGGHAAYARARRWEDFEPTGYGQDI